MRKKSTTSPQQKEKIHVLSLLIIVVQTLKVTQSSHWTAYLGKEVIFPHFSTQNLRGPLLPLREANPS